MKNISILIVAMIVCTLSVKANNLRLSNVSFVNVNPTTQTVGIRFTISWENSWRDSINWDAAWVIAKYKNPSTGLWRHVKMNTSGATNGTGVSANVQVYSDSVGAFIYRNTISGGNFTDTNIIIYWKYGNAGLTNLTNVEIRVFGQEMVYIPTGEFQCAHFMNYNNNMWGGIVNPHIKGPRMMIAGTSATFPIINSNLLRVELASKYTVSYPNGVSTVKPDNIFTFNINKNGLDFNNDSILDNVAFPTGFNPFYIEKYENSEQSYCDILNTLSSTQVANIGIAGSTIQLSGGTYFAGAPNRACNFATDQRLFALGDWLGLRPMTLFEFEKAQRGPLSVDFDPNFRSSECLSATEKNNYYDNENGLDTVPLTCLQYYNTDPLSSPFISTLNGFGYSVSPSKFLVRSGQFARTNSNRYSGGLSYYGVSELIGNAGDPYISPRTQSFNSINGNGELGTSGFSDIMVWIETESNNIHNGHQDESSYHIGNENRSSYNIINNSLGGTIGRGFRFVRSAE